MNARITGYFCWAGLVLLHLVWWTWWSPSPHPLLALGLSVLPLSLPLLLVRRAPTRALLLVGMLCLFFFSHGVMEAWAAPTSRIPALMEIVLSLGAIGTLGWNARGYRRKR